MRSKKAWALVVFCTPGLAFVSPGHAAQPPTSTVARCHCENSPLLATSGRHGSIVAWQEGYNESLVARRIRRDGKLGRKRKLAGRTKTVSDEGAWLAAGPSGAAVAVWEDNGGGIRARRLTRSGKVGRIHQIAVAGSLVDEGGGDLDVDVAVDARGDATIVWSPVGTESSQDPGPFRTNVYARRLTARGRVGRRLTLPVDPGVNRWPRVAYAPSGKRMVAWGLGRVFVATVGIGGNVVLGDGLDPQLAIDARGNAIVVWRYGASVGGVDQFGLRGRRLYAGGGLGPLHAIADTGNYLGDIHRLAVDGAGNVTVAWRDFAEDNVRLRRIGADDTLGPVVDLSVSGVGAEAYQARLENSAPAVAVDSARNVTTAWMRLLPPASSPVYTIEARGVAGNGALGSVQTLAGPTTYASDPKVVSDAPGVALVAWSDGHKRYGYGGDAIRVARLVWPKEARAR
jgi:hypothetical protein